VSVAAVMLVKDEADIVEATVRHLLWHVDFVSVADNLSTDGTYELLHALQAEFGHDRLEVGLDEEIAYYQARKTSELAARMLDLGHGWVIPCDADEIWHANDLRPLRDYLAGIAPDVAQIEAPIYHHLPTSLDPGAGEGYAATAGPPIPPPARIGWRQRSHGQLPKVACRLRPGLEIHQGNHSAYAPGGGLKGSGLSIRHFPWRSEDQFVRKIRNGAAAYAATNLPADTGAHWRAFGSPPDEARIRDWYRTWAHQPDPARDDTLLYDPAPWTPASAA
jgi:glycosyltransferase involved in cell wall biosynthesis